tara:strand:- start:3027 stop:4118 length:1092 start_codon:yes stop_codon:yes gene_type:complete
MTITLRLCFALLLVCSVWTDAQAKQPPSASVIFGWTATYDKDGLHLSQPDYPKTSVRIVVDRRANVDNAISFEEAKAYFSEQNGCTGLKTAVTKKDYGYAAIVAGLGNKTVDTSKLPVYEYEAWDSQNTPRCVLIAQKYHGGGMQIAVIVDDGEIFKAKRIEIKEVLTEHFKKQNSEVYAAEKAQAKQTQKKNAEPLCIGAQSEKNWTVTWSPKDSRVYAKATELVDKPDRGSVFVSFQMKAKEEKTSDKKTDNVIENNDFYIFVSAKGTAKDAQMTMPVKQKIIVDGKTIYSWTKGTQWSPLTADVVMALEKGQTADLVLEDIGRVRFPLPKLLWMLKWGDVHYNQARIKTQLGKCEPVSTP